VSTTFQGARVDGGFVPSSDALGSRLPRGACTSVQGSPSSSLISCRSFGCRTVGCFTTRGRGESGLLLCMAALNIVGGVQQLFQQVLKPLLVWVRSAPFGGHAVLSASRPRRAPAVAGGCVRHSGQVLTRSYSFSHSARSRARLAQLPGPAVLDGAAGLVRHTRIGERG